MAGASRVAGASRTNLPSTTRKSASHCRSTWDSPTSTSRTLGTISSPLLLLLLPLVPPLLELLLLLLLLLLLPGGGLNPPHIHYLISISIRIRIRISISISISISI